ncbi:tyrosine-type recombinase/integrase [Butyrivibrio sp. AC2005]|uniref:tyrosine-type recombinase/integrase n=1 Tax=Butyrivibrio sp. AC2005 TaxID=1280672 RepID=UPI0004099BA9|nr:tyrosine-type recombinase/integrase [Butyrivibrio sp. AC2005]
MGENSAYYNSLYQKRKDATVQVKELLPQHAHGFIDECILNSQINTAYNYAHDILFFYQYIKETNPICEKLEIEDITIDVVKKLTHQDITEYQIYIAAGHKKTNGVVKPASSSAIARKMAALRKYFKYLIRYDYLTEDPTIKAVSKKTDNDNKEIRRLNEEQVKQLVKAVSETNVDSYHSRMLSEQTAKRDLAIIILLLRTGIRVSECVGLDLSDVDFETNTITIVRKGGAADELKINEMIRNTLKDYISTERPVLLQDEEDSALFISLKHRRLSLRSVEKMIEKYGKKAGYNKRLTPHTLRRTFGTSLYNNTGDIYMVASILGHKDINTTSKHYTAIDEKRKQMAVEIDIYNMDKDSSL